MIASLPAGIPPPPGASASQASAQPGPVFPDNYVPARSESFSVSLHMSVAAAEGSTEKPNPNPNSTQISVSPVRESSMVSDNANSNTTLTGSLVPEDPIMPEGPSSPRGHGGSAPPLLRSPSGTQSGPSTLANQIIREPLPTNVFNNVSINGTNPPRFSQEGDNHRMYGGNYIGGGGRGYGNWQDHGQGGFRPEPFGWNMYPHPLPQQHHGHPPPFFRPPMPMTVPAPYVNPYIQPFVNTLLPPDVARPVYPVQVLPPLPENHRRIPYSAQPLPAVMPLPHPPLMLQPNLEAISKQVEYYFSYENLIKDEYLRGFMDEEGWVHISVIVGFNKVKKLTNNLPYSIACVLEALRSSNVVELKGEKLRKRNDWERWILPPAYLATVESRINSRQGIALGGF